MSAGTLSAFERSLGRLDVDSTRTVADELDDALASVTLDPVVGAPLPFGGCSLPDWVRTDPTPAELDEAKTGVTAAELAVADYGSVVIRATPDATEQVSLFPDVHVAVVRAADVVPGMPEAFERLAEWTADGDSAIVATGPSATADMGALVKGAHGPKEVRVVVVE
ncbi:LUD domain-containing protein [Haloprofundus halobius]|uniref:LUD domain-containing protein n=1 Tax=Haloprofundus halobius TaxID=2876194 RepID=UPI001CCCEDBF|nr:LUD domain-containing protein [Haloprofundus halobius]